MPCRFALLEATLTLVKLYQQVCVAGAGALGLQVGGTPWASAAVVNVRSLAPSLPQFTFRLLAGQVPLKVRSILTLGPSDGIKVTVHPR